MWLFKEQRLSVPHWRSQRPYLMAQKVLALDLFEFWCFVCKIDVETEGFLIWRGMCTLQNHNYSYKEEKLKN